jgi:hypothetical protein
MIWKNVLLFIIYFFNYYFFSENWTFFLTNYIFEIFVFISYNECFILIF